MDDVTQRPTVNGVVETALYVSDLTRAARFYRDLLGMRELMEEPGRLIALRAGDHQVLLLFARGGSADGGRTPNGGQIPPHDARGQIHVGLGIAADEREAWERRLAEYGVAIESRVWGQTGGVSLYFRDPDGNLVELLTPGVWAIY
jgi:catechol 2,3-dioxygenase-like lactoylglutathione lyase family enzyme